MKSELRKKINLQLDRILFNAGDSSAEQPAKLPSLFYPRAHTHTHTHRAMSMFRWNCMGCVWARCIVWTAAQRSTKRNVYNVLLSDFVISEFWHVFFSSLGAFRLSIHLISCIPYNMYIVQCTCWKSYKIHWNNTAAERRYFSSISAIFLIFFAALPLSCSHTRSLPMDIYICRVLGFRFSFIYSFFVVVAFSRSVMIGPQIISWIGFSYRIFYVWDKRQRKADESSNRNAIFWRLDGWIVRCCSIS